MAEFQWRFQRRSGSATLGGSLEVTQSTGKRTAVVQDITGFYVDGAKLLDELTIVHHAPLATKPKIIRVLADVDDPGFAALVNALAAARPSADLRSLPRKEALARLGVVDARKIAMLVVPLLLIGSTLVTSLPQLIYGVDHGEDRLAVSELGSRPLTSHNVVLTGEIDTGNYTWVTQTKGGVKTTKYSLFPLRAPGAPHDAPVPVVLYSRGGRGALPTGTEWRCLMRDALWDGFTSQQRKWLVQDQINVTDDTRLCDLTRTPAHAAIFARLIFATAQRIPEGRIFGRVGVKGIYEHTMVMADNIAQAVVDRF